MKPILFYLWMIMLILAMSCQDYQRMTGITTRESKEVSFNKATIIGSIDDLSDLPHQSYGFCYGTSEIPALTDSIIELGSSPKVGQFDAVLKQLAPNTTYFVSAFIQEGDQYIFGKPVRFETTDAPVPVVTAIAASNISYTTAVFGGLIEDADNDTILESGLCWATSQNPTINDNKLINRQGTNPFQYTISGLLPGTTYYGRAYATNKSGTGYSDYVVIQTLPFALPTVNTGSANQVLDESAYCTGTLIAKGDGDILSMGIIYGTSNDLTGVDNDTLEIVFYSNTTEIWAYLQGLQPATIYYFRAFAQNFGGYGMGNIESFTTLANIDLPVVEFNTCEDYYGSAINCVATVISDGGGLDQYGFVWSKSNSLPTTDDGNYSQNNLPVNEYSVQIQYKFLEPNVTYFFRAFAQNKAGIAYSETIQIVTKVPEGPAVSTVKVCQVHATEAMVIGKEDPWPGYQGYPTTHGACWNTTGNPAVDDGISQVQEGFIQTGKNYIQFKIKSLTPQTTYYLKFWGESENGIKYGEQIQFTTLAANEVITDFEGNEYAFVSIGNQVWMSENLRSKKYRDGTDIQNLFIYNYDETNIDFLGIHYGADAAVYNTTLDACPAGWHVPTKAEWETLANSLGGLQAAGNHLKEAGDIHWYKDNMGDNTSGFNAWGTGCMIGGNLESPSVTARYWSSTRESDQVNWSVYLKDEKSEMQLQNISNAGNNFNIRCIKNSKK